MYQLIEIENRLFLPSTFTNIKFSAAQSQITGRCLVKKMALSPFFPQRLHISYPDNRLNSLCSHRTFLCALLSLLFESGDQVNFNSFCIISYLIQSLEDNRSFFELKMNCNTINYFCFFMMRNIFTQIHVNRSG